MALGKENNAPELRELALLHRDGGLLSLGLHHSLVVEQHDPGLVFAGFGDSEPRIVKNIDTRTQRQ